MMIRWPAFITRVDREPIVLLWLRACLALILIYRESFNALAAFYDPDLSSRVTEPVFFVGVAIVLLAGAGTRLCYLVLSVFYIHYNFSLSIMNLGPLLLVPLCWAGLALDRDPLYSVDRVLMARSDAYRRLAQWPGASVPVETYNFVFGIVFFVYAVNSLGALNFHLRDPYWLHGQTVHAMLTNNYLSRYWEAFRWIESRSPAALRGFSAASLVLQTIFQASMLALVYVYWGRWFVVLQGFAFFLFSFVLLQLSILPVVELLTLTLLFGRWISDSRGRRTNVRLPLTVSRAAVLGLAISVSTISVGSTIARSMGRNIGYLGSSLEHAIVYLSIWPPDVFNVLDLKLGEQWYVIYRAPDPGTDRQLVPVFSEQGSRLYYHLSDVLYFGNALMWRRGAIFVADWTNGVPADLDRLVERMCEFDFRLNRFPTLQKYSVYVYWDRSMEMGLTPAERYEKRLVRTTEIELGN